MQRKFINTSLAGCILAGMAAAAGLPPAAADNSRPVSAIRAAATRPAADASAAVTYAVPMQHARQLLESAHARQDDLRLLPGWHDVEILEKRTLEIETLMQGGDLLRALEGAASWQFHLLREQVVNNALNAIPLLLLGPFGDESRTDAASEGRPARDPAAYLTTPFLREFRADAVPHRFDLAGFRPDLQAEYAGFQGRPCRWQPGVMTERLDLPYATDDYWTVAYIYGEFYAPEARQAHFRWKAGNLAGIMCFVNDRCYTGNPLNKKPYLFNGYGNITFVNEAGWNRILFKIIQKRGAWFKFQIFEGYNFKQGTPMYDLRYRLPAAIGEPPLFGAGPASGGINAPPPREAAGGTRASRLQEKRLKN